MPIISPQALKEKGIIPRFFRGTVAPRKLLARLETWEAFLMFQCFNAG